MNPFHRALGIFGVVSAAALVSAADRDYFLKRPVAETLIGTVSLLKGQQEVAPTWYDPWATPSKAAKEPAKPQASSRATKQQTQKIRAASVQPRPKKDRAKLSAIQPHSPARGVRQLPP